MEDICKTKQELIEELKTLRSRLRRQERKQGSPVCSPMTAAEEDRNQKELMKIFEKAPLPYHSLDKKANIIDVNQLWLNILGYKRKDVIGHNFSEFIPPEYHGEFKKCFRKFKQSNSVDHIEMEMVHKKGTRIAVTFFGKVDRDKKGVFLRTHCIFEDIAERKLMERGLFESQRRYAIAEQIGNFGHWSRDFSKNSGAWSEGMFSIFGVNPDDFRSDFNYFLELVHPADRKLLKQSIEASMSVHEPMDVEYRIIRPDGKERFVHSMADIEFDQGGRAVGLFGISHDITERKHAEEELRTSEAKLSNAMEIARIGYWDYDVNDDLFTFNDQFYSIFRTTADKVGGYQMSPASYARRFLHPDDRPLVALEMKKALETTDPLFSRQLEHRIIYGNGETGYISVRYFVIKDDKGRTIRTFGANQDITERKLTEKALMKREEQFRDAQEVAKIGSWNYDVSTEQPEWSLQLFRMFGIDPEKGEPNYAEHKKYIHTDDWEKFDDSVMSAIESGIGYDIEIRLVQPSGKIVWVNARCKAKTENGKVVELIGTTQDITESKKAETSLQKHAIFLKTLIETIPFPLFYKDSAGRYTGFNRAFEKIVGRSRDQMIGKTVFEVYDREPEDITRKFYVMDRKLLEHPGVQHYEGKMVNASGELRDIIFDKATFMGEDGSVDGLVGIMTDITEKKKAEERIDRYHERLGELASQLALAGENERHRLADELHDVAGQNLALAKIKLAELRDLPGDEDMGNRKNRLDYVLQLIEEASASTRSLTFELSPPILYELGFEATAEWLGEQILKRYGIEFHFEDDGQQKPLAEDMKVLLYLSLRELIVNIAKHSQARNAILSIRREGDNISVSVSDDGVGFDASDMDHQIMKAASFGLFSTRERLERLGGHLEIASQPGQGTTVRMVTPLKK